MYMFMMIIIMHLVYEARMCGYGMHTTVWCWPDWGGHWAGWSGRLAKLPHLTKRLTKG